MPLHPPAPLQSSFLIDNAKAIVREYGGDLNQLRQAAHQNPAQV